ncbi:MAG: hypothetical protein ACOX9R_11025 [Armatimonadota bacterium]|jgi:hypothetical protein
MRLSSRLTPLVVALAMLIVPEVVMAQSVDLGDGFMEHGVATPISNHRGTVATVDGNGEPVVLSWLRDYRGCYSLLMVNAVSGEYEQYTTPRIGDDPFASVLSTGNRYYTHFGSVFMEFDPTVPGFTFHTDTAPRMAMSMTEGDDGTIWSATYPSSGVVSYNPESGEFRDYGHLYEQNWAQYPRAIAVDDRGWVYVGVGSTATQILILDPESGEATPVIPEEERVHGYPPIDRYQDGKAYAKAGEQWYELYDGVATKIDAAPEGAKKPIIASSQSLYHRDFGTGHTLRSLDLVSRVLTVETPEGEIVSHEFDYESLGAHLMGLAAASDGTVCGGTAFPMRFFSYNPRTDEMINRTAYGQWNTIAPTDTLFYVGGYGGGYMLEWDPSKPWVDTVRGEQDTNPLYLAQASPDINRPHALLVHPDGKHVILAGTPGYGLTGGGLMFWDREAKQELILKHEQLIENHSVHAMAPLPRGELLCGTTISPGTGGETKAEVAELFILDMDTKQVIWRQVFEGARTITDMIVAPNGLIYGVADRARFFVFAPATRRVIIDRNITEQFGSTVSQQGPRVFIEGPDDRLFMLFNRGIAEIDTTPKSHEITMLVESPITVGDGGAYLDGRIYFGYQSKIYSWALPEDE